MRIIKKFIGALALLVSLLSFSLALFAGGLIQCKEDHCGAGCIIGSCDDAETCSGCVITGCLQNGKRGLQGCAYIGN